MTNRMNDIGDLAKLEDFGTRSTPEEIAEAPVYGSATIKATVMERWRVRVAPLVLVAYLGTGVLAAPLEAQKFGMGFTVASWGPLALEISLEFPGALLLGSALFLGELSFLEGQRESGHYRAEYSPQATRIEVHREVVEMDPEGIIRRSVFKIRYRHVLDEYDRIDLGRGKGQLELQKDGRLNFVNSPFRGHMFVFYDQSLIVFDSKSKPVLVVLPRTGGKFGVLLRRSQEGRTAAEVLLGVKL